MNIGSRMDVITEIKQNKLATFAIVVGVWASYLLLKAAYNLFLHPLRKFPGPKLAAIGPYYEFYYDVVKDGMFLWETERLHKEYGKLEDQSVEYL